MTEGGRYPCVGNILSGVGVSEEMTRMVEGTHVSLLRQIMRKKAWRINKQDVGNTRSQRGVEGSCNEDSGHIHELQAGDGGVVCGSKTNI